MVKSLFVAATLALLPFTVYNVEPASAADKTCKKWKHPDSGQIQMTCHTVYTDRVIVDFYLDGVPQYQMVIAR